MTDKIVNSILYRLKKAHEKLEFSYHGIDELPKIVFVHVPKCGGTSINTALGEKYRYSYSRIHPIPIHKASMKFFKTQEEYLDNKLKLEVAPQLGSGVLLFNLAERGQKCLTGHIYYNKKMIYSLKEMGYNFITIVRNPVDRLFSNYFFNFYRQGIFSTDEENFEEYLHKQKYAGSLFIRYFGGYRTDNNYDSDNAIDNALQNLTEFSVIGRLDKMDSFLKKIEHKLGLSLLIHKKNKNPAPPKEYRKIKNSDKYREMVKEICQPDISLLERLPTCNI